MSDVYVLNTKEAIDSLEQIAGVYIYEQNGVALYIGKSVNVRARLRSHAQNALSNEKERQYVDGADHLRIIQTDSELNALLLESSLIQKHHPKYNVRWRDDKSYLYIKLSMKEEFPKVSIVRREHIKGNAYFGPFPSQYAAEQILKMIRRVFPFCMQKRITKQPCFYSKLGLCDPCPNIISTAEEKKRYRANIRNLKQTLEGKSTNVLKLQYKQMQDYAKNAEYEKAMVVRDRIFALERMFTYHMSYDASEIYNQSELAIDELKKLLVPYFPNLTSLHRIECYDISNLQQQQATASMVVFTDGQMHKGEYRKFKVKHPKTLSDFDMMAEVLERRLNQSWDRPDLIILDGGKPQMRHVLPVMESSGAETIPVIGIAKRPDRLVVGTKDMPTIRPRMNNYGFNMVQHMRDEAHRFAKKYHTHLRTKGTFPTA